VAAVARRRGATGERLTRAAGAKTKGDRAVSPSEPETMALLGRDAYSPQELADLIGLPVSFVRRAARTGRLVAATGDSEPARIARADALRWLAGVRPATPALRFPARPSPDPGN
jgi:hypothetical protein